MQGMQGWLIAFTARLSTLGDFIVAHWSRQVPVWVFRSRRHELLFSFSWRSLRVCFKIQLISSKSYFPIKGLIARLGHVLISAVTDHMQVTDLLLCRASVMSTQLAFLQAEVIKNELGRWCSMPYHNTRSPPPPPFAFGWKKAATPCTK